MSLQIVDYVAGLNVQQIHVRTVARRRRNDVSIWTYISAREPSFQFELKRASSALRVVDVATVW